MLQRNLEDILNRNMMEYSQYVIKHRALPDIRDGLKPASRNILITMHNMKLNGFTKSQNVTGQVMQIHPHGDCYGTVVGMVQCDNNLTPLIDGKGSFGQYTSKELQPAAARYTEIQLSDIAKTFFDEINLDVVDYIPTYDDKSEIPEVLPAKFPAILHYCQSGIAVGMNSNIPSYNLKELNDCVIKYLKYGEIDVLIPDFATGGIIDNNENVMMKLHKTGEGTIRLRAKININNNILEVIEIPYTTTREAIIESIIVNIKNKNLPEITNVRDLTGLDGMSIEIVTKKKINMHDLMQKLYKLTPLESTFVVKINILNNNKPVTMGIENIIKNWVDWRQQCIVRKIKHQLNKLVEQLNKLTLNCLIKKYQVTILQLLVNNKNEEDVIRKIMKKCRIDYEDAKYVSNFKLKHFNKLHIEEQEEQKRLISKEINKLENILKNLNLVNKIIINELTEINEKFGTDRRTSIDEFNNSIISTNTDDLDKYKWNILITKDGYIKKLKTELSRYKMKDGDEILHQYFMTNNDEILAYKGNEIYKFKINNIKECKNDMGTYICTDNQYDFYVSLTHKTKYILNVYENKLSKIDADAYRTRTNRAKIYPASANQKLINVIALNKDIDIILEYDNKQITMNTNELKAATNRTVSGKAIKFDKIII